MSRILSIAIAIGLLAFAFLTIRSFKTTHQPPQTDSAKLALPANEASNFLEWREFAAPTGQFKVLLPALPQHATDKILDPKTQEPRKYDTFVSADDEGTAFMISTITFPRKLEEEDTDATLKSVVNDMLARNKDNKLKAMNFNKFRNHKALDFSLTNGELVVAGKVFAQGHTLYVLSMIDKAETFNPKELDFFVNSFDVTEDKNNSNKR
jgi:hypothetical protein